MYGQGSVITGLADDSDLDLILVWDEGVPREPTLEQQSKLTAHGELALKRSELGGYAVDLMHVPKRVLDGWLDELEQGNGYTGNAWPLPVYVAAGLAESKLLVDPTGLGEQYRERVRTPAPAVVDGVRRQLETATPTYLKELDRASACDNRWLHANLSVELHKLTYMAWFLAEGHYPPFPKYLSQWYERFGMDRSIRDLEGAYWTITDPGEATGVLQALVTAVLELDS
ncbi:hypothetical protein AB0E69_12435 [Kribbella sp. NPDC026611]|uniref:hypothetical protein n=1 Tax=Kribbella sp. NPDC026611 TaxID=3154911 RepID=UPI0033EFAFE1